MKIDFLDQFEFFTGVPDSLLAPLSSYLIARFGIDPKHHIIAANEGNCVALAAGYHLATGGVPVVYLQNSGLGNIINPVASLMNDKVYGVPCIFFVGWRGEPNVHDEPQHIFQGEITLQLLHDLDIQTFVIDKQTTSAQVTAQLKAWQSLLKAGKQVAFVVKKGALEFDGATKYHNEHKLMREEVIREIVKNVQDDVIVSTTGKASRELFEIREQMGQGHDRDFLTVGSMGHSSTIAWGIAAQQPQRKVWCIDGDGAMLMHMGSMAVLGTYKPANLVHIVINNGAHESVGGMPTVAGTLDVVGVAKACGYERVSSVNDLTALNAALKQAKQKQALTLIEVKCAIGARADLGRPTTTAKANKENFMAYLKK